MARTHRHATPNRVDHRNPHDEDERYESATSEMPDINQARFREVMLRHTDAGTWIAKRSNPWQALLALVLIEQGLTESTPDRDQSSGPGTPPRTIG